MSKELILQELKKRGAVPKTQNNEIINELQKRGIDTSKSLIKPIEELPDVPTDIPAILDETQIPEKNKRTKAVEDYLSSPAFGRLALEITGGVVGAIAAPAIAPAVLVGRAAAFLRPALQKTFTSMAGAGFGEATGAGISQTFDPRFDSKDDFEKIASDVSKDLLRAFATGATGEGAGILVNKSIAKVIGKNKKLIDGAEEAIETIENQRQKIFTGGENIYGKKLIDAAKTGQLTPGLLQEGQTIDLLENIAELSLIGGGSIRYAREGAESIAQSGIDDFVKNFKMVSDNNELGVLFQKTLTDDLNAFRSVSNVKYKAVDKALANTNPQAVSILDLKKFANDELKKIGLKTQNKEIINFLNDINRNPNNLSFQSANKIRSDLLEISREFTTEGLGKKKQRLAVEMSDKITKAMDNAIIPIETQQLYKNANKFYREGAEIFNTDLFTKIINNDPELVYKSIVAAGDRSTLIKKTFDIIDKRIKDKTTKLNLKNSIRGQFLEDAISKSQKTTGQYGPELDANKLNNFISKKRLTANAMFEPEQIKNLEKFVNALAFSQGRLKKKGGLPGAIFIQMKQSGAVMTLAGAGTAGALGNIPLATSIILGPEVLAKAFTNPKIIKSLTTGIKYNQNPSIVGRSFRQVIAVMTKEGIISEDQKDVIEKEIKEAGY